MNRKTAYVSPEAEVFGILPVGDVCTSGDPASFSGSQGTAGDSVSDDDVVDGGSF